MQPFEISQSYKYNFKTFYYEKNPIVPACTVFTLCLLQ